MLRTFPVLIYNRTWRKNSVSTHHPPPPRNSKNKFVLAANEVKLDRNDGTGGWIVNTGPYDNAQLAECLWRSPISQNWTRKTIASIHPNPNQALTYLRTLFDDGCAWNSRIPRLTTISGKRQVIIYSGSLSDIPAQASAQNINESEDEWQAIPYPANIQEQSVLIHGTSYAILVDGPQKQLASWLFIRWMSDPERQAKLATASDTLPITQSAAELMQDDARINPQAKAFYPNLASAQSAPRSPSWPIVRNILADAAWQTSNPTLKSIKFPLISSK